MPTPKSQKIGEIHRITYEKTFFEKVKEVLYGLAGLAAAFFVIGLIVS